MTHPFATIEQAISELKQGRMIILVDDEDRENEGDLVFAADYATPEAINFMTRFGRGLICLPMAPSLIERLHLPMMVSNNRSPYGTAFTVSIEASCGVSTGISAKDRAHTIQVAINPATTPDDIITPGHIFPLRAEPLGVLRRCGQTEGSVDLMRLAGLTPAAVICEILNDDGSMSRRDDLLVFSKQHGIPMVCIKDLIDYRIQHEMLINAITTVSLPVKQHGDFSMTIFHNQLDSSEHIAMVKKPVSKSTPPLVRIHSECLTGDVFDSSKCDCGDQLNASLSMIGAEGGILIYLRQEGRGIGLTNKLKAYALQEQGFDTVDANLHLGLPVDNRHYGVAYQILRYFEIEALRLLTNNPEKVKAMMHYGLTVSERVPLVATPTPENRDYLKTKQDKLGHHLDIDSGKNGVQKDACCIKQVNKN